MARTHQNVLLALDSDSEGANGTAVVWKRCSPMFDAVFEVLGTGLWATKQLISAVRGHLNQTKRMPLWLFGWRWPAVVAELGSGAESTSDPHWCGCGAVEVGRWVRTPGDYGCAGQPPRVPKPGRAG